MFYICMNTFLHVQRPLVTFIVSLQTARLCSKCFVVMISFQCQRTPTEAESIPPFYRRKTGGPERLSKLARVTQLGRVRMSAHTLCVWFQSCSSPYSITGGNRTLCKEASSVHTR